MLNLNASYNYNLILSKFSKLARYASSLTKPIISFKFK